MAPAAARAWCDQPDPSRACWLGDSTATTWSRTWRRSRPGPPLANMRRPRAGPGQATATTVHKRLLRTSNGAAQAIDVPVVRPEDRSATRSGRHAGLAAMSRRSVTRGRTYAVYLPFSACFHLDSGHVGQFFPDFYFDRGKIFLPQRCIQRGLQKIRTCPLGHADPAAGASSNTSRCHSDMAAHRA